MENPRPCYSPSALVNADPLTDARARADLALRADAWPSLKATAWTFVFATGAIAAFGVALVNQRLITKSQFGWLIVGAAFLTGPVVYAAHELRRLYERSLALYELANAMKQYEILLRDARAERDQLQQRNVELMHQYAALQVVSGLRGRLERGEVDRGQ